MKKAQTLVEYILIFAIIGFVAFMFVTKFDFQSIKNYVFMRPQDSNSSQIRIEPMTDDK